MTIHDIILTILIIPHVLIFPGLIASFILFNGESITWIERIILSIVLSLCLVPLLVFYGNLLGLNFQYHNILKELIALYVFLGLGAAITAAVKILNDKDAPIVYYRKKPQRSLAANTQHKKLFEIKSLNIFNSLTKELFQISLFTYFILVVLDTVKPGFVSYFFNKSILLLIVIISGLIFIITYHFTRKKSTTNTLPFWDWKSLMQYLDEKKHTEQQNINKPMSKWNIYYVSLITLAGGVLVYYKTAEVQGLSITVTFLVMAMLFFISSRIISERE